jgi:hypothetical protein
MSLMRIGSPFTVATTALPCAAALGGAPAARGPGAAERAPGAGATDDCAKAAPETPAASVIAPRIGAVVLFNKRMKTSYYVGGR